MNVYNKAVNEYCTFRAISKIKSSKKRRVEV
jgi:hypothetical protein